MEKLEKLQNIPIEILEVARHYVIFINLWYTLLYITFGYIFAILIKYIYKLDKKEEIKEEEGILGIIIIFCFIIYMLLFLINMPSIISNLFIPEFATIQLLLN